MRVIAGFFWYWIAPILGVLFVLGVIRSSVVDWNDVPTGSMKPTIVEGDRIFVNKVAYDLKLPFTNYRLLRWGGPERGDVVVFHSPTDSTLYVKRVVGLPGDEIAMRDNQLWVNGRPADYAPLGMTVAREEPFDEPEPRQLVREQFPHRAYAIALTPESPGVTTFGPVRVPEGHYFVMGDNRDNSFDSRRFGFVPRDHITGQATTVVMSLDAERNYAPRWERFFHPLS